jgi:hypothetical protein
MLAVLGVGMFCVGVRLAVAGCVSLYVVQARLPSLGSIDTSSACLLQGNQQEWHQLLNSSKAAMGCGCSRQPALF